jgi:hypothetical protein
MKKKLDLQPIKDAPGYMKDKNTGVVINTNTAEYERILERRRHQKQLSEVNNEVDSLKQELEEMKKLLKKALK